MDPDCPNPVTPRAACGTRSSSISMPSCSTQWRPARTRTWRWRELPTRPPPKPAAPRRQAEDQPADTESEQPAHPPAPQISPQLSPGDQAAYQRKTGDDTAAAEKNLQETSGKQLNAAQQDLVGKIRSFLSQSRDASKDGDWSRAQNLAQKARLLSDELINSF